MDLSAPALTWLHGHVLGALSGTFTRHAKEATVAEVVPCIYRGAVLREARCEPCGGPRTVEVFACSFAIAGQQPHAECQLTKRAIGIHPCLTCLDRARP